MINPSATVYTYLSGQAGVTALTSTRIWTERTWPQRSYKPSQGQALVLEMLPGRVDYSSAIFSVPFAFRCYGEDESAANTLYRALFDAFQDATAAPMYKAVMATMGQTLRDADAPSDWVYVYCSFMCHFRNL